MAKHQCDANAHSSDPVPIIGLCIAGFSLVCLLLMLSDVFFAFRRNCRIPRRLFPLNSVTLTLLAIVAKLPIDLTTDMPRARDQLSKLTGTTMICTCMGFMAPSLANCKKSVSIANLASLSIFIVTVVVNICIQMRTGVISSFVPEHIIMISFMFMLLFALWFHIVEENVKNEGEQISLIHRVNIWYISACINTSQLPSVCISSVSSAIGPICLLCLLVLLQAIYRSIAIKSIEFCAGVSDYRWSMWIIIITQIAATIISTLTIAFRWLAIFRYFRIDGFTYLTEDAQKAAKAMFSKRRSILTTDISFINLVMIFFVIFMNVPMYAICLIISWVPRGIKSKLRCCMHKPRDDIFSSLPWFIKEYYAADMEHDDSRRRLIQRCVDDMNKWSSESLFESPHMVDMLSTLNHLPTTPQLLNSFQETGKKTRRNDVYNGITCLSLVALVKVVAASVPDPSNLIIKHMGDTLREAFKIVYYVDGKMNVKNEDSVKRKLASELWKDGDFAKRMKDLVSENPNDPLGSAISKLERAYEAVVDSQMKSSDPTLVCGEFIILSNFILEQGYATIKELYVGVRRLFCEMLHNFLSQLPICAYKDFHDASNEDWKIRATYLTKLLCKLDLRLEGKVQWKFVDGRPADGCL